MSKRIIVMILIIIMLAMLLTSCGKSSSPERLVEKFFEAVKAGDMETSMACFAPNIQQEYDAGVSISNSILGLFGLNLDSGSLLNWIIGATNLDAYKNYDFKVTGSTMTDKTHARVNVDVYIDGKKSTTTTMSCIKIDGEWYLEK